MYVGRRIYYDTKNGEVLVNTGEHFGFLKKNTIEEDINVYKKLSERNLDSFDYIDLDYGQYSQDFMECVSYRINVETKTLEFSYSDDSQGPQEPIYQAPLSEKFAQLEQENKLLKAQNAALVEQTEFHEEVLTEIILAINS